MDLESVAQRLDANEKLKIRYRVPVKAADGSQVLEERVDKLLDVDLDRKMLYVAFKGEAVIWVNRDEAIEIVSE